MITRKRNEGSISYRHVEDRWEVRISQGRDIHGKLRRKSLYAKTEEEAVKLLRSAGGQVANGEILTASSLTIARLLRQWMDNSHDDLRPTTRRGYEGAIRLHLTPAFGHLRVGQLTRPMVLQWLNRHKAEQNGVHRRRIALAHAVLRSALTWARSMELVSTNAAQLPRQPNQKKTTQAKRRQKTLTLAQAIALLDAAKGHRLEALFMVILLCGLRLGEALGLPWDAISPSGDMHIYQQLQRVDGEWIIQEPKTESANRVLELPDLCMTALQTHRQRQREDRLKAGKDWVETGLVFTTYQLHRGRGKVGSYLDQKNINRVLYRLLEQIDAPRLSAHALRHSAVSILIAEGMRGEEIQQLVGHAEQRTTLDLYGHLMKRTAVKAARHMEAVFGK